MVDGVRESIGAALQTFDVIKRKILSDHLSAAEMADAEQELLDLNRKLAEQVIEFHEEQTAKEEQQKKVLKLKL